MELFAVFLFLLYASQDSLAVTVEVQEGEPSVVLPCRISKTLEDIVTVKWSRFDLNPNTVHQRDESDDLRGQNQVFRGRTSMRPDALYSGDFSLTLRKPQLLDSGIYICSMTEDQEETALSGVQLHVKGRIPQKPKKKNKLTSSYATLTLLLFRRRKDLEASLQLPLLPLRHLSVPPP